VQNLYSKHAGPFHGEQHLPNTRISLRNLFSPETETHIAVTVRITSKRSFIKNLINIPLFISRSVTEEALAEAKTN
jgi:hypothetical protein